MAENTLATGIRANNMERVSMSMPREKKSTENGNTERELDGLKTD